MQVVNHIVNYHEFFIKFQVSQLSIDPFSAKIFCENVAIAHFVNLFHQFRPILSQFFNVLARLKVFHRLALVLLGHVEYIAIER